MRKVFVLLLAVILTSSAAMAAGMNKIGQTGGFNTVDAGISNRLSIGTSVTNLDTNNVDTVSISMGVLNHLEVSMARADNATNIYGAKFGFSFKEDDLKTAFALGLVGGDVESLSSLNYFDYYLVGQFTLEDALDVALTIRSTDASGEREYLGEGLVGYEVVNGWSIYGEYLQKPNNVDNVWSFYIERNTGTAVVKAGITDTGAATGIDEDQAFLCASIDI